MSVPQNFQEEGPERARESGSDHEHTYPLLYRLRERMAVYGCETAVHWGSMIVISPFANEDGVRLADTISCRPRPDDEGRMWFAGFGNRWIAEADRVPDAAMMIAASLRIGGKA